MEVLAGRGQSHRRDASRPHGYQKREGSESGTTAGGINAEAFLTRRPHRTAESTVNSSGSSARPGSVPTSTAPATSSAGPSGLRRPSRILLGGGMMQGTGGLADHPTLPPLSPGSQANGAAVHNLSGAVSRHGSGGSGDASVSSGQPHSGPIASSSTPPSSSARNRAGGAAAAGGVGSSPSSSRLRPSQATAMTGLRPRLGAAGGGPGADRVGSSAATRSGLGSGGTSSGSGAASTARPAGRLARGSTAAANAAGGVATTTAGARTQPRPQLRRGTGPVAGPGSAAARAAEARAAAATLAAAAAAGVEGADEEGDPSTTAPPAQANAGSEPGTLSVCRPRHHSPPHVAPPGESSTTSAATSGATPPHSTPRPLHDAGSRPVPTSTTTTSHTHASSSIAANERSSAAAPRPSTPTTDPNSSHVPRTSSARSSNNVLYQWQQPGSGPGNSPQTQPAPPDASSLGIGPLSMFGPLGALAAHASTQPLSTSRPQSTAADGGEARRPPTPPTAATAGLTVVPAASTAAVEGLASGAGRPPSASVRTSPAAVHEHGPATSSGRPRSGSSSSAQAAAAQPLRRGGAPASTAQALATTVLPPQAPSSGASHADRRTGMRPSLTSFTERRGPNASPPGPSDTQAASLAATTAGLSSSPGRSAGRGAAAAHSASSTSSSRMQRTVATAAAASVATSAGTRSAGAGGALRVASARSELDVVLGSEGGGVTSESSGSTLFGATERVGAPRGIRAAAAVAAARGAVAGGGGGVSAPSTITLQPPHAMQGDHRQGGVRDPSPASLRGGEAGATGQRRRPSVGPLGSDHGAPSAAGGFRALSRRQDSASVYADGSSDAASSSVRVGGGTRAGVGQPGGASRAAAATAAMTRMMYDTHVYDSESSSEGDDELSGVAGGGGMRHAVLRPPQRLFRVQVNQQAAEATTFGPTRPTGLPRSFIPPAQLRSRRQTSDDDGVVGGSLAIGGRAGGGGGGGGFQERFLADLRRRDAERAALMHLLTAGNEEELLRQAEEEQLALALMLSLQEARNAGTGGSPTGLAGSVGSNLPLLAPRTLTLRVAEDGRLLGVDVGLGIGMGMGVSMGVAEPALSYEELLNLEDVKVTTPQEVLDALPYNTYDGTTCAPDGACAICQCDYQKGDQLVRLPCSHVLHGGCARQWLGEYSKKCPICKQSVC